MRYNLPRNKRMASEIVTIPKAPDPLETRMMDYVRAGWTVSENKRTRVTLYRGQPGEEVVRLSLDEQGQVVTEGPALPAFFLDGRARAWLMLLAILAAVFALAWVLGIFRF